MAPQLFERQLNDGAWGITVATVWQMLVCRRFGVERVLMANQLVGEQEMRSVFRAMRDDPQFSFFCLVDSAENVRQLHGAVRQAGLGRPLSVLLELGALGSRAGCRSIDEAVTLARLIDACAPHLELCGIEGFEGAIDVGNGEHAEASVRSFIGSATDLVQRGIGLGVFGNRRPILTMGGSIYFDLVATHPGVQGLRDHCDIVLRSGCYLTHDSGMMTDNFRRVCGRTAELASSGEAFRPALTVWGRIQSHPEPGLAILNVGKRDVSFDIDLPVAERWFRPGLHSSPVRIAGQAIAAEINDQHLMLRTSPSAGFRVGDLIGLGVSHPCTTFDKWRLIHVLDDGFNVVEGIMTFF
jgi:D-serine dehydratase